MGGRRIWNWGIRGWREMGCLQSILGLRSSREEGVRVEMVPCRRSLALEPGVLLVGGLVQELVPVLSEDQDLVLLRTSYVLAGPPAVGDLTAVHRVLVKLEDPRACLAYLASVSLVRHSLQLV
jgi:hypothetical protein